MSRTNVFGGFRNTFWKTKTILEVLRFSMYISVPIFSSCIYANPERMHYIINYLKLVEYPAGVTDLPLGDDLIKKGKEDDALIASYQKSMEAGQKKP